MITLVMPTYNRRATIGRAIRSVRAQTHEDWELVIVDGGSSDDTAEVIASFHDPRIRYFPEPTNEGVTAARNRGLDEARGDFIGMLDSDDELVANALETLLATLASVSGRLDAISCNCIDGRTGRFTGRGLDHDRFLTVPLSLERARGEHWGIFHRRILAGRRFDPRVRGYEGHLWCRIHDGVLWYYLHRGLRIYHREAPNRISNGRGHDYELYWQIFDYDPELLRLYARWSRKAFVRFVRTAAFEFLRARDQLHLSQAIAALDAVDARALAAMFRAAAHARWMRLPQ